MCGPGDGVNRVSEKPSRQTRHERKGEKMGKINKTGECFSMWETWTFCLRSQVPCKRKRVFQVSTKGDFAVMCKTRSKEYVNLE